MYMKLRNLLAAAFCLMAAASCGQKFNSVGNEEFARLIEETDSLQLIDVRTAEEYAEARIPTSVNIDVKDSSFMSKVAETIDKTKAVAVYCRSGVRSAEAAKQLTKAGFIVTNLEGGINSWREERRTVADANDYIVFDGEQAPDFTTTIYEGEEVTLSELRGKVIMLQFTASWCGICRHEMPFIEKDIWLKHKDNEDFVLMAVDLKETDEKIALMKEVTGISYPIARDPEAKIFDLYNLHGAGVTRNVLIDRDGRIVMRTRRFQEEEFTALVAKIDEMLK